MVINEPVAELRSTSTFHGAPLVAVDGDFETRWAAGSRAVTFMSERVHRRFVVSAVVIAIGGAITFAFLA